MALREASEITKPMVTVQPEFIGAGCNQVSQCMTWSRSRADGNGLVAFGTGSLIAIYDPQRKCIVETLAGHSGRVNTVSWLEHWSTGLAKESRDGRFHLVSGSADGSVIVWKRDAARKWRLCSQLFLSTEGKESTDESKRSAITRVCSIKKADGVALIAAGDSEGRVAVWQSDISTSDVRQGSSAGLPEWCLLMLAAEGPKHIVESMDFAFLPCDLEGLEEECVILAAGGVDKRVRLFSGRLSRNSDDLSPKPTLTKVLTLEGHLDWIRSMTFAYVNADSEEDTSNTSPNGKIDLLLATAAQDQRIRLWRISARKIVGSSEKSSMVAKELDSDDQDEPDEEVDLDESISLDTSRNELTFRLDAAGNEEYVVRNEAMLIGHEDWITALHWQPRRLRNDIGSASHGEVSGKMSSVEWLLKHSDQPLALASSSMDCTLMIWRPQSLEEEQLRTVYSVKKRRGKHGVWMPEVRVGQIGGNNLGFIGCSFGPGGNSLLGVGYSGSFHLWQSQKNCSIATMGTEAVEEEEDHDGDIWEPEVSISGHFNAVLDLQWDPSENYLVSVSLDQTARLFAPWCHCTSDSGAVIGKTGSCAHFGENWHELSRPQVHGYDLTALTFLGGHERPHCLVSAADEKVLRVFDAPQVVVDSLRLVSNIVVDEGFSKTKRVQTAYIPELGLSNKAVDTSIGESTLDTETTTSIPQEGPDDFRSTDDARTAQEAAESAAAAAAHLSDLTTLRPPLEEDILRHTLWPETKKLYGHGNEVIAVASAHDGSFVVSACKAREPENAALLVWDTSRWCKQQQLRGHGSSVVQLEVSHDDKYIISVSKDRTFCVFARASARDDFALVARVKGHKRIIWSVSFTPDDMFFATGSRDSTVKMWTSGAQAEPFKEVDELPVFPCAVTAVAFAPVHTNGYYLAVGLEDGTIQIWSGHCGSKDWRMCVTIDGIHGHCDSIKRLRWCPVKVTDDTKRGDTLLRLASGSADHTLRIHLIRTAQEGTVQG